MRKSTTKVFLTLALIFLAVGGANSKTELNLPSVWSGTTLEASTYSFGGGWNGAATWAGAYSNLADWSGDDYEYVWVKYSGFTGNLKMAIEYDEWTKQESWGDVFFQQEVYFTEPSGVLGIAIDKTTTFINGSAATDGEHIGEIYAKYVRQIVFQDRGVASTLTIEGLYVGTYAEMLADMGYDTSKNHVLKITNPSTAGTQIYSYKANYSLSSTLTEGKKYTVSAKICAADVTKGTPMKFVLTGLTAKYGNEIYIYANTFYEVSSEFTAGSDNTGIEIEFGFANGVVYIDDVSCVEEGTTTNLVANDDFETPLSTEGWEVPGWTGQSMSQAELAIDEVALPPLKFTIGSAGWTTICASAPVQVTNDVEAYYAKYDTEKENVKLTPVTSIHQWGRGILHGDAGDYYFPQIAAADVTANWDDNGLKVSWGEIIGDGSTIYVLAKKDDVVGFYLLEADATIPSGKAYLEIPASAPSYSYIGFGDGTTAIDGVRNQMEEVREGIFDLSGRRVANPTKGLYIVNGKKVIIK